MPLYSVGHRLSANQISSTYLNSWLRYNYFRSWKQMSATSEFYFRFRFRLYHRNRHAILHQAAEFHPNRTTYCRNMTSYRFFFKTAAAAAQYYFRFHICWCHCIKKVKIYQQTKFRRRISIHAWDITTSFWKTNVRHISIFGFYFGYIPAVGMLFCTRLPNFIQIGPPTADIWRHVAF